EKDLLTSLCEGTAALSFESPSGRWVRLVLVRRVVTANLNVAVVARAPWAYLGFVQLPRWRGSIFEVPPGDPTDFDLPRPDRPHGSGSIWIIDKAKGRSGVNPDRPFRLQRPAP